MIQIWTDGSCYPNPGRGGWSAIIKKDTKEYNLFGYKENCTNNRMEILAIIEALKALKPTDDVIQIFSDASYVVNSFKNKWIEGWIENNWQKNGKERPNRDLFSELYKVASKFNIEWNWIKGHENNENNIKCDKMAANARKHLKKSVVHGI